MQREKLKNILKLPVSVDVIDPTLSRNLSAVDAPTTTCPLSITRLYMECTSVIFFFI